MKLRKCANGHFYDESQYDNCPFCEQIDMGDRDQSGDEYTVGSHSQGGEEQAYFEEQVPSQGRSEEQANQRLFLEYPDEPECQTPSQEGGLESGEAESVFSQIDVDEAERRVFFRGDDIPPERPMPPERSAEKEEVPQRRWDGQFRRQNLPRGGGYRPEGHPHFFEGMAQADENKTVGYYPRRIGVEPVVGWLVIVEGAGKGESFLLHTGRNFIGRSQEMDVVLHGDKSVSRVRHGILVYEPREKVFFIQPGDSRELFYRNGEVVLEKLLLESYDVLQFGETKLMFVALCGEHFSWEDSGGFKEDF